MTSAASISFRARRVSASGVPAPCRRSRSSAGARPPSRSLRASCAVTPCAATPVAEPVDGPRRAEPPTARRDDPRRCDMSWMPATDPEFGDAQSCDALELVVVPRVRDLGGFAVRRALPQAKRQMVGPFIFFDQMGPVQFVAGQGMDVRPHPHIGLATVTYLFDGRIMHRDSEGNEREITPGAMNLMTAGGGIAHSERTPPDARISGIAISGIQSWVALPATHEETAPSFQHFSAADLPTVADRGLWARVIAGSAFGQISPVDTLSDWLYAEVRLDAGASAPFDPDQEERAIYLVDGEIRVAS